VAIPAHICACPFIGPMRLMAAVHCLSPGTDELFPSHGASGSYPADLRYSPGRSPLQGNIVLQRPSHSDLLEPGFWIVCEEPNI
jgi:hypothetical protein